MHPPKSLLSTGLPQNGLTEVPVCLNSLGTKGLCTQPTPQNKGTCSTGLQTGCKPVLFILIFNLYHPYTKTNSNVKFLWKIDKAKTSGWP